MQQNQLFGFGSYAPQEASASSQQLLAFPPTAESNITLGGYMQSDETLAGPGPSDVNPDLFSGLDATSIEDFFAQSSYDPTPNLDHSPLSSFSVSPELDFFPLFGDAGVEAGVVDDSPPVRPLDFFDFGGFDPSDDTPLFPSSSKPIDAPSTIQNNAYNFFPDLDLPLESLVQPAPNFPSSFAPPLPQQQQIIAPSPTLSTTSTMQPPAIPASSSRPESRSNPSSATSSTTTGKATRKAPAPTGYRKGVAADQLLGMDAPTQSRSYVTPSATSKKKIPAAFENRKPTKKRKTSPSNEDTPAGPSSSAVADAVPDSLEDAITAKRRQNTLAARKSRIRKANHLQGLESLVGIVSAERDLLLQFARASMERCPELGVEWRKRLESVGGLGGVGGEKGESEARRLMDGGADEGEEE